MATETVRASNAYLSGARALAAGIETLVYATVALFVSWQATLAAVAVGAAIALGLGRLVRSARKAGRRQTDALVSLLRRMADTLQSVKALKTMGLAGQANVVLEAETRRLNKAMRKEVLNVEGLRAVYEPVAIAFVAGGAYAVVTFWGLHLASVVVLMVLLLRVLKLAGKLQQEYQKMVVNESAYWSLQRTIARAEEEPEAEPHGRTPVFERELVLEDVYFAFGERPILRGLTLRLPAKSFTTVIGPSGAGKTTILDLIAGLLLPNAGRLTLDGVPLADCNLQAWRRMIGYVPQETLLLHDSVLHNVTLGDPDLTEADAERALRAAGAWEFVSAMPEGVQTLVGERGSKLSGGQRQRVSIARALVRRPKLLILDEATSALDPVSEAALCETLGRLRGEVTVLAVSHQTGLAAIADRVMRLEEGVVAPVAASEALAVAT
jgi:ATP-binding cassette subfamily C protein